MLKKIMLALSFLISSPAAFAGTLSYDCHFGFSDGTGEEHLVSIPEGRAGNVSAADGDILLSLGYNSTESNVKVNLTIVHSGETVVTFVSSSQDIVLQTFNPKLDTSVMVSCNQK